MSFRDRYKDAASSVHILQNDFQKEENFSPAACCGFDRYVFFPRLTHSDCISLGGHSSILQYCSFFPPVGGSVCSLRHRDSLKSFSIPPFGPGLFSYSTVRHFAQCSSDLFLSRCNSERVLGLLVVRPSIISSSID